jgi:AcrR family transcriptional regulator
MSVGRPRRAERTEPSRKHLLAAAIDCFARFGYQGASIDRIARHAGVTKGALYYHFRDKEELLYEAVSARVGEFEHHVLAEVGPGDDTLASLRRVIDACFFHATVSNHRRFIITLMIEALDTHPGLSVKFQRILRRMRAFLAEVVRRGQDGGAVRGDVDPEDTAAVIAGAIMGAEIQHYQDPEEVDLRRVLDTLLAQLADWLTPRTEAVATRGGLSA